MPDDDDLSAAARRLQSAIRRERSGVAVDQARSFMAARPDALLEVISKLERAARRRTPNEVAIQAYGLMFAQGLEVLRYQIENEQRWAAELLDTVRATMATRAAAGKIGPNLLMLLMNAFIDARLEPGDALTRQLGELAATAAGSGDRRRDPNADIEALFASILETAG
jgi:hypothetical protein